MAKRLSISKVMVRGVTEETQYASSETLVEAVAALKAKHNVPLKKYLKDIMNGLVDSIGVTKDKPYFYFHATRLDLSKKISITVKESDKIVEFSIPISEAENFVREYQ